MKKIAHVNPVVIEITGAKVVMSRDEYRKVLNTLNTVVDAVNSLIDNNEKNHSDINTVKETVQALAISLDTL